MRKGHARERNLKIGTLINGLAESKGAANYKIDLRTTRHGPFFDLGGKVGRIEIFAPFVEQHEPGFRLKLLQQLLAFLFAKFFLREFSGIFKRSQGKQFELAVMLKLLLVKAHALLDKRFLVFPGLDKPDFKHLQKYKSPRLRRLLRYSFNNLFVDAEQFNFKNKGLVWSDHLSGAALAISQIARQEDAELRTNRHQLKCFCPAGNNTV